MVRVKKLAAQLKAVQETIALMHTQLRQMENNIDQLFEQDGLDWESHKTATLCLEQCRADVNRTQDIVCVSALAMVIHMVCHCISLMVILVVYHFIYESR